MFVEPYVEGGRHVEVQILADTHGTVWAARHPRLLPPAPPPEGDRGGPGTRPRRPNSREELHALAVRAARAVDYAGAGTVEFLVADDEAHFLEMNTRLQVEHPVTEAVFGLDLVALNRSGSPKGAALADEPPARARPRRRGPPLRRGPGDRLGPADRHPAPPRRCPTAVRLDTGYADGDAIGVHYDPMLAKVVAHAPTRAEAVRKLAGALERATIHGPVTNRELLVRSLRHPEFTAARMDTGFYDRHLRRPDRARPPTRTPPWPPPSPTRTAAPASAAGATCPRQPQTKRYATAGEEHEVRYRHTRAGPGGGRGAGACTPTPARVVLEVDGVQRQFEVSRGTATEVYVNGTHALTALPRFPDPTTQHAPGSLLAPMPGTVVRLAEGLGRGSRRAGRAAPDLAGGDEDGAPHHRTGLRHAHRAARRPRPPGEVGALLAVVQTT